MQLLRGTITSVVTIFTAVGSGYEMGDDGNTGNTHAAKPQSGEAARTATNVRDQINDELWKTMLHARIELTTFGS